MNAALKPIVDEIFDVETVTEDGIKKNFTQLAADGFKAVMDAPALVQNLPGVKADCVALISDPAAGVDLISYVGGKLAAKAPALADVVTKSLDLGLSSAVKGYALYKAVVAMKAAPAAVAAPAAPAQA